MTGDKLPALVTTSPPSTQISGSTIIGGATQPGGFLALSTPEKTSLIGAGSHEAAN